MLRLIKTLLPSKVRFAIFRLLEYKQWHERQLKRSVLLRNSVPNATWIETGTYFGDTALFLSQHFEKVITIEPCPELFDRAVKRFSTNKNIQIINGLSEEIFPRLLPQMTGNVNFWLDGHYSTGVTHKGPVDTPIIDELKYIESNINHFVRFAILIDDVRCFKQYANYPDLDYLVDWSKRNSLQWHIEHDIFIATNY